MNVVTIPKKEYKRLREAEKKLKTVMGGEGIVREKKKAFEAAFGILKDGFGKGSSVGYVGKLRKAWRK